MQAQGSSGLQRQVGRGGEGGGGSVWGLLLQSIDIHGRKPAVLRMTEAGHCSRRGDFFERGVMHLNVYVVGTLAAKQEGGVI